MRLPNALLLVWSLSLGWPVTLGARQSGPVAEVSAGTILFTEESEPFVGGAARFYLLPRVSVGPEVTYIFGDNHSHLMATGNVGFDFFRMDTGQSRRVTPFGVLGGGIFHTRDRFFARTFTSTEGAFTAGGGIRTLLGNRVTLGADLRVGWELHIRLGGTIGVRLGK
jgi:hypothetical protein